MPELSVIMPVRNAETTVVHAIKSTLAAMPMDSELVVLDDASTDRSFEQVTQLHDPRIRLMQNERNAGVAASLNAMLRQTDSRFVARMDADDISLPWRFWYGKKRIVSSGGATFSGTIKFGNRRVRPFLPLPVSPRCAPYLLLLVNPFAHSSMMASRAVIEQVGGYRSVPSEDYDLWLRLSLRGTSLSRFRVPGLLYREHSNQVTGNIAWRAQAATNRETADAHSELARALTGSSSIGEFASVRTGSGASKRSRQEFAARVLQSAKHLNAGEKLVLVRAASTVASHE